MCPLRLIILSLFIFVISACTPGSRQAEPIPVRDLSLAPGQGVNIQVNSGLVKISGTDNYPGQVHISGQIAQPDRTAFQVSSQPQEWVIEAKYSPRLFSPAGTPVILEVQVPRDVPVSVTTFDAGVEIRDVSGKVSVNSTAGNVTADRLQGQVSLRSARGNVQASSLSGDISVVGEAGILSILNAHGKIGSTTIMGTIQWNGSVGAADSVNLETDHAPVDILLGSDSDVALSANTTSGAMICPPIFSSTTRVCNGKLGAGKGGFKTRTVSGNVSVQVKP